MKRLHIFLCLWAAVASTSFDAHAGAWPKLSKTKVDTGNCAEALQVAKAAFDSDAFYLFGPPPLPKDLPSQLVLKPRDGDISGGVGIEADKDVFEELPIDKRSIYWQKTAADGYRFVAQDIAFNWRGDRYSLFAVGDATSSDEFLADLRANSATRKFVPIIEERFRPPLIFRNRASGRYWFIQPGEPGDFLADWHVYVAEPSGVTLRCMVQFRPEVQRATALLPKPVRTLARLLDQTLGSGLGLNEGSLHPTHRLRTDVEHTWANAALRPWVSGTPYNSRKEVDAGLKRWSQKGASCRKHYEAIQCQYPVAERSLARYYRQHFNRSASEAKKLSAYILDIAIRSYYKFHSEDRGYSTDNEVRKSPWSKQ